MVIVNLPRMELFAMHKVEKLSAKQLYLSFQAFLNINISPSDS